jgi:hypothetical protein
MASYTNSDLNNGSIISCVITASNNCQTINTVTSNALTMTVFQRPDFGVVAPITICSGSPVYFDPSAGQGASIPVGTTYTWVASAVNNLNESSNSNGAIGNQVLNTLVNVSNDVQTVTYTFSGISNNCASLNTGILNVTVTPVVAQISNPQSICQGSSVELFVTGGVQYFWSEQGEPSNSMNFPYLSNPIASPNTSTQYDVLITDVNGCSTTRSVSITVKPKPELFTLGDWSICSEAVTNINLTSSLVGSTFSWQAHPLGNLFSSDLSGSTSQINQIWLNNGMQSENVLYQMAAHKNGCSSDTAEVILQVKPIPHLISNIESSICENQNFVYSPEFWVPFTTHHWTRLSSSGNWDSTSPSSGNGVIEQSFSSVIQNPQVEFEIVGNLSGCVSYDTLRLNLHTIPVSLTQTDFSFCAGTSATVELQDWVSLGYSVEWLSSALFTPNNMATSLYLGEISIQTTVVATNEFGCSNEQLVSIDILENPSGIFLGPSDVCEGAPMSWEASNQNYNVYNWYLDGQLYSSQSGTIGLDLSEGTYEIGLMVFDDNDCQDMYSQIVEVHSSPVPFIYGDTVMCQNSNDVMFSTTATPFAINWEVDNATILGGQGTSNLYLNMGDGISSDIVLSVQNSFGCVGYDTLLVSLSQGVADAPVQLGLIGNATITHPNSEYSIYDWGKTNISNGIETSQLMNLQYYNFGSLNLDQYYYWVETSNQEGCITRSYYNWPEYANFVESLSDNSSVLFYPNPAHEFLFIDQRVENYSIYSLDGRILFSGKNGGNIKLDVLPAALYILKIEMEGRLEFHQFIKQ